jgi:hypothetical protein
MKINYSFIKGLRDLLISEDWQSQLNNRILEIDELLKVTPEMKLQEVISKIELKKKLNEEKIQSIKEQHQKKLNELVNEKLEIESCLKNESYKLGMAPFDEIENAKLTLTNIHIFEANIPNMPFNDKAVGAIKKMLQTNFDKLFEKNSSNLSNKSIEYHSDSESVEFIKKIINKEAITIEDICNVYSPQETELEETTLYDDELEPTQKDFREKFAPQLLSFYQVVDPKLLEHSYKLTQFIQQFFLTDRKNDSSSLALNLAFCFPSKEDIDSFLEKKVKFTNFNSIQKALKISPEDYLEGKGLSKAEFNVWQQLNSKYQEKALNLFKKAFKLKASGFDIWENAKSNTIEKLYKIVKEEIHNLKYENEASYPEELGKLAHKYELAQSEFDQIVKEYLPLRKNNDNLPDILFTILQSHEKTKEEFIFCKIQPGDFTGLFIGLATASCKMVGGSGEKLLKDGFTNEDAAFYVLKRKMKNGSEKIIAQVSAWLSTNLEGQKVLVFNSYEYLRLPKQQGEKLFINVIQELAKQLTKFGLAELHIGIGGPTPYLNIQLHDYKLIPVNPKIFQYQGANRTYKITETNAKEICLGEVIYTKPEKFECENFEQFCDQNLLLNSVKMININPELFKTFDSNIKQVLTNSKALMYLLSKKMISLDVLLPLANKYSITSWALVGNENEIKLSKRIEILKEIFADSNKDTEVKYKILNSFHLIQPILIEEIATDKLIEVLARSVYMPSVLSKYTEINEIKRLDLVKELFKFSPDIIVKICNTKLSYDFDNQEVNQIHVYAEEFEKETLGDFNEEN